VSLDTKTTKEISDNIIASLEVTLGQTIPLLPKSFLRVLSKSLAAIFVLLYKYAGFMFLQIFVKTASAKETTIFGVAINPLTIWGELIGVGAPTSATNAELTIEITVQNQTGTLPTGSQLIGGTNNVVYLTLGGVVLDAATKQVDVVAVSDPSGGGGAGTIGNLDPGAILNFANPLPNVASATVVIAQVVTAADAEDPEVYRQRVIDRFQKRPQGGAYADYEIWGEEVAGIINVYPYTSACPGQVDVYAEATELSSGSPDGFPTTPQLQAVYDSIQLDDNGLASRRPAGALVNVFSITRPDFDVEISGLNVFDVATVQDTIETALTQYFLDAEPFIHGLSIPPRRDRITQTAVAGIVDDIVNAAGGIFLGAFVFKDTLSTPLYGLGEGEKAKLGSITYV